MRWNPNTPDGGEGTRPTIDDYPHEEMKELYRKSTTAWNPKVDDDYILRMSKSSLGTFEWCPQQYYLEKFEGLKGEEEPHHIRGKNVHDITEYFWDNIDDVLPEIIKLHSEGYIERARAMMYDVVPLPPTPYMFGEEAQIQQWLDWQFERFLITRGVGWKPVSCEAQVYGHRVIEIDGVPIPFVMSGFIDTIFADGNGFSLMELKTGKWKKDKKPRMRKEMQFYKMMLEHSPHHELLPITHWGWEFPGGDINNGDGAHMYYESTKDAKFTPKSLDKAVVRLIEAHMKQEFPPDPGYRRFKCDWCSYQDACPAWDRDFVNEEIDTNAKKRKERRAKRNGKK